MYKNGETWKLIIMIIIVSFNTISSCYNATDMIALNLNLYI